MNIYQNNLQFLLVAFLLYIVPNSGLCQENQEDLNPRKLFDRSTFLFENNLYGLSARQGQLFKQLPQMLTRGNSLGLMVLNDLQIDLCNIRLDRSFAEQKMLNTINLHKPSPDLVSGYLALGSMYYNQKQYNKAISIYDKVNLSNLPLFDLSEGCFKQAYSHLLQKDFVKTKELLSQIIDIKNEYYYPANYYYGISNYYLGNYDDAVTSFQKVKSSDVYKNFVPYYITQIYFAQNQPEKVIAHGEIALKNNELRNRKEIRLLLGQSYFIRKEYDEALPHLEYYEENTEKLTIDEFYQLGFTQYQLKNYKSAVETFRELSLLDSKLGQIVNYYMADCFHKIGDLISARATFKKVSNMSYNLGMQEEATFNYGKLSAEAGLEREAINTLFKLNKKSPYYSQASDIINDLLENTSDYASAILIIESHKEPNAKLWATYQQVTLKNAMLLQAQGDYQASLTNLDKSLQHRISKPLTAQALFWKGQILQKEGNPNASIEAIKEFVKIANNLKSLPEESSVAMGHYILGYNYLTLRKYEDAKYSFENAVSSFSEIQNVSNPIIENSVITDAYIRLGDCYFKTNNYKAASKNYIHAIKREKGNFVYAIYQKAIIEGLQDEPYDKIITLKEITTKYKSSEYVDDSYFQLGETYYSQDNTDNAYQSYLELVNQFPMSPLRNQALIKMGLISYNKGDLNKATEHYKTVISSGPTSKEAESALLGLREIYINDLGNPDEYINYTNNIPGYQVTASTADSLAMSVGMSKYYEGEYEKAIMGFNNYLDKYPNGFNRLEAQYFRGESYTLLKKYASALSDYEAVIAFGNSKYYTTSLKKSALLAYNHAQSFEKSLKYYDLYLQNVSDPAEQLMSHLGIMRSAFRINNQEKLRSSALIVSEHSLALKEDKGAAFYYLGKASQKGQEYEVSKSYYKKVDGILDNAIAAESRYNIAEITFAQGKLAEAEKLVNIANDKNASYPYWIAKGVLLLADIYVKKNDLLLARAACEAVIENFVDEKQISDAAIAKLKIITDLEQKKDRIKPKSNNSLELTPSGKNE
jgi:tetratricopeptide (TPR) repeat protein